MNVKVTIILPLAIVLFVYGVYCLPAEENGFPCDYPLESCIFYSPYRRLHPSATVYKFEFSEEEPSHVRLLERQPFAPTATYSFERATVKCVAMKSKELSLIMYQNTVLYNITCKFTSLTLVQEFYKLVTRDRPSKENYMTIATLQKSDDTVLAAPAIVYLEGEERDKIIVIKNDTDDPVLIFPLIAVSEKIQREDDHTKIDLHIRINGGPPVLYKFSFETVPQAANWIALFDFE